MSYVPQNWFFISKYIGYTIYHKEMQRGVFQIDNNCIPIRNHICVCVCMCFNMHTSCAKEVQFTLQTPKWTFLLRLLFFRILLAKASCHLLPICWEMALKAVAATTVITNQAITPREAGNRFFNISKMEVSQASRLFDRVNVKEIGNLRFYIELFLFQQLISVIAGHGGPYWA